KVRAMVVPGSTSVKRAAEDEGLDLVFKSAGFEWRSAGCSMCLGMNPDILAPGERCASTSNRNFEGRQGAGGRTHLMSPPMAAAESGSGSAREHATWAMRDAGFDAVIAPSFGDIFRANCSKTGILAVSLPESQVRHLIDLASEDPTLSISIDLEAQEVRGVDF